MNSRSATRQPARNAAGHSIAGSDVGVGSVQVEPARRRWRAARERGERHDSPLVAVEHVAHQHCARLEPARTLVDEQVDGVVVLEDLNRRTRRTAGGEGAPPPRRPTAPGVPPPRRRAARACACDHPPGEIVVPPSSFFENAPRARSARGCARPFGHDRAHDLLVTEPQRPPGCRPRAFPGVVVAPDRGHAALRQAVLDSSSVRLVTMATRHGARPPGRTSAGDAAAMTR